MANLQVIQHPLITTSGVEVWLLHEPVARLSGNKFYKLRDNLLAAKALGKSRVISFGGAWSNHIVALAHAARDAGLGSLGLIRGEARFANNASLLDAQSAGMQLRFLSREEYRQRESGQYLQSLQNDHPDALILPEGGSNLRAVKSCADMLSSLQPEFLRSLDLVAAAVGTGATLTGLRSSLIQGQQARGYCVVRDPVRQQRMDHWWQQLGGSDTALSNIPSTRPADPERGFPNGEAGLHLVDAIAPGYAKLDDSHWHWIHWLAQHYAIWLDPLYTAKMLTAVFNELQTGQFMPGTRLLLIHTGGWQGWRGFADRSEHHNGLVDTINRHYSAVTQEP